MNISELEQLSRRIRGKLVEMSFKSRAPHLGSALSCIDMLVAAYWSALFIDPENPLDPKRDRFILSKGHAGAALFATLCFRGFFQTEMLDTYANPGSCLEEHPGPGCAPGVEVASGSLGHGLSLGAGLALGGRIQGHPYKVFVLLGDGECNEGAIWEAAMFASKQGLDRVIVMIDFNKWQATGRSCEVMALEPLREKWEAFGWSTYETDGHDLKSLKEIFTNVPDGSGRPIAVVAHTIKGKGVSFMEDDNNWHYKIPTKEEVVRAQQELGLL